MVIRKAMGMQAVYLGWRLTTLEEVHGLPSTSLREETEDMISKLTRRISYLREGEKYLLHAAISVLRDNWHIPILRRLVAGCEQVLDEDVADMYDIKRLLDEHGLFVPAARDDDSARNNGDQDTETGPLLSGWGPGSWADESQGGAEGRPIYSTFEAS